MSKILRVYKHEFSGYHNKYRIKSIILLGYKCQLCGSEKNVHLHHKDSNPLNNNPLNWQRLCASCHRHVHAVYLPVKMGKIKIKNSLPLLENFSALEKQAREFIDKIRSEYSSKVKYSKLTLRQLVVFYLFVHRNISYTDIGKLFNESPQNIREMYKGALKNLKKDVMKDA